MTAEATSADTTRGSRVGLEETPSTSGAARGLSLRVNFSWAFVGNGVYAACKWAALALLAKATTPEGVGQFALGVAIAAPTFMLLDLQLRSVQATDARGERPFGTYASLRVLTTALGLIAVAGFAVVTQPSAEAVWVVVLVGAWRACESLSDVVYGGLQRLERLDRVSQSLLIKGPLSLAFMAAALYWTGSVAGGVLGLAVGAAVTLVAFDLPNARAWAGPFRWVGVSKLLRLARLALPLGVVMMLISLNTNVPRYWVEAELGTAALGVFSALVYVVVAGGTVVAALGQAAAPRLSQYAAAGHVDEFRRLLGRLLLVGAGLGTAGVLVAAVGGRWVLSLLYTAEYARHTGVFVGVMLVSAVLYLDSFLGYALTAAGAFRPQLPLFAVTVAVTALVGAVTVPAWGLAGAVVAMGASAVVQGVGAVWILRRALAGPSPSAPAV